MTEKKIPAVNFAVWSMNGGAVPAELIVKIEKTIDRTLREYDEHEGLRLLSQTVKE